MGMAAVEASFKQHIASVAPVTKWMVENISLPSVIKMIKMYLPLLPSKNTINGQVVPPPSDIMKELNRGMKKRNKIVHIGEVKMSSKELKEILLAIKDLIWILDYYQGYEWALKYVRSETLEAMRSE